RVGRWRERDRIDREVAERVADDLDRSAAVRDQEDRRARIGVRAAGVAIERAAGAVRRSTAAAWQVAARLQAWLTGVVMAGRGGLHRLAVGARAVTTAADVDTAAATAVDLVVGSGDLSHIASSQKHDEEDCSS